MLRESRSVAVPSRAQNNLGATLVLLLSFKVYFLRKFDEPLLATAQLTKLGLTPAPQGSIFLSNCQRIEGATCNEGDRNRFLLPVKELEVLGSRSDLDTV